MTRKSKKKTPIVMEDLIVAFEDFSSMAYVQNFLDLETGEIIRISDLEGDEEEAKAYEKIDSDPDRYLKIDNLPSSESYRQMADFTETVKDPNLRRKLAEDLKGRGAFSRFRQTIYGYPEEQKRWFDFKDELMRKLAMDWLEENEVDYQIIEK
jgi:hypothetical protein